MMKTFMSDPNKVCLLKELVLKYGQNWKLIQKLLKASNIDMRCITLQLIWSKCAKRKGLTIEEELDVFAFGIHCAADTAMMNKYVKERWSYILPKRIGWFIPRFVRAFKELINIFNLTDFVNVRRPQVIQSYLQLTQMDDLNQQIKDIKVRTKQFGRVLIIIHQNISTDFSIRCELITKETNEQIVTQNINDIKLISRILDRITRSVEQQASEKWKLKLHERQILEYIAQRKGLVNSEQLSADRGSNSIVQKSTKKKVKQDQS